MSKTPKLDALGGDWFNDHSDALEYEQVLGDFDVFEPVVWGKRPVSVVEAQMIVDIWITDMSLTEGADDAVCEMEARWLDSYGKLHIVRPKHRVFLDELDGFAQQLAKMEFCDPQSVGEVVSGLTNPSEEEEE